MTALAWTYNSLSTALQAWLDDTDSDWTSNFQGSLNGTQLGSPAPILVNDYLIQLGEQRLIDDFDLTVFDQIATATTTISITTSSVTRPAGIIVTDDVGYQSLVAPVGKYIPLERRDYSFVQDYLDPTVQGPPRYYAEADTLTWIVAPYSDQVYTIVAGGPFVPQSLIDIKNPGTATTYLSTLLAQCMLEATLAEASKFLKNEPKRQVQEEMYIKKLGPMKKRLRALRRDTLESPRNVSSEQPEGATPGNREA